MADLKREFEMKDLGRAKRILGIKIKRDRDKKLLFLSQEMYLKKVLNRFRMSDAKLVSTPLSQQFKLSMDQAPESKEDKEFMYEVPYVNAVGSLMYAMVCTRPDLSYSITL